MAGGEWSPHLVPQRAQLTVKLLVGLDVLVHFPLQLLLRVLQTLDLLLRFIHLPLRRLQSLSQLKGDNESQEQSTDPDYFTTVSYFSAVVYLVSLALQVDVLLVRLHLHLLHLALQLTVCLLQAVVVSESKKHQEITSLLQLPVTQHLPSVFQARDTLTLTTTGKVIRESFLLYGYHTI